MSHDAFSAIATSIYPGAELQRITRLTGGVSADVYQLELKLADDVATSIVLRVHGATHAGHRAELEYQLLRALHLSSLPVPEPLYVDESENMLANPFLVMEFVEGNTAIPVGQQYRCIDLMAEALLAIHALPTETMP
nr:phosphotransferase [Acidiferrobacterales bacterium]